MSEALRLYRAIYRAAAKMPTRDRRDYVRRRLRYEYEQCRQETRPERIEFLLRLAETQEIRRMHSDLAGLWCLLLAAGDRAGASRAPREYVFQSRLPPHVNRSA
ncbi:Complex 1 lyr protein, partial [Globisporangium splendens]